MTNTNYFKLIARVVSEHTGHELDEITPESSFADDLNIGEIEFAEIVGEIEETLDVDLTEENEEIKTVADFVEVLKEHID